MCWLQTKIFDAVEYIVVQHGFHYYILAPSRLTLLVLKQNFICDSIIPAP